MRSELVKKKKEKEKKREARRDDGLTIGWCGTGAQVTGAASISPLMMFLFYFKRHTVNMMRQFDPPTSHTTVAMVMSRIYSLSFTQTPPLAWV